MLLAWIYITLLCRGWGAILRAVPARAGAFPDTALPFLGLGAVGTLLGLASLFVPLGGFAIQILLAVPPLLFALKGGIRPPGARLLNPFDLSRPFLWPWIACALLFGLMGSWEITHPDTLAYHTSTIRWIENYPVIRGLVHLNHRLGYQGLWYQLCAAFSYRFTGSTALSFLPPLFALWCAGYLLQQAQQATRRGTLPALLWLALLAYLLCDFNALRLTASSAGNDLAAAAFVWLALHLSFRVTDSDEPGLAATFCALLATAIKLSAAPVLLLLLLQLLSPEKRRARFAAAAAASLLVLAPLLLRNVLTTGYPLYPSPLAGINVDWKLAPGEARYELQYVQAWARRPWLQTGADVKSVLESPIRDWMPNWWHARSAAERFMLLLLLPSLPVATVRLRQGENRRMRSLVLVVAVTGLLYWFLQAPDPRFGLGSIIAVIAMALYPSGKIDTLPQWPVKIACILLALAVGVYSAYRCACYFRPIQLWRPLGVTEARYDTIRCQGVIFYQPRSVRDAERPLPVPALSRPCDSIRLRGTRIEDGFRAP